MVEECETRDCPACVAAGCCRCDATVAEQTERIEALEAKCALLAASLKQSERETADAHAAGFRAGLERASAYVEDADDGVPLQCLADAIRSLTPDSPTPPAAAPGDWPDLLHTPVGPASGRLLKSTPVNAPVSAATVEEKAVGRMCDAYGQGQECGWRDAMLEAAAFMDDDQCIDIPDYSRRTAVAYFQCRAEDFALKKPTPPPSDAGTED